MFSGGTNWGFMSGANYGRSYSPRPDTPVRYIPITTFIRLLVPDKEYGEPTEEYHMCRDVLDEFTGRAKRTDRVRNMKRRKSAGWSFVRGGISFDNLDVLAAAKREYVHPLYHGGYAAGLRLYNVQKSRYLLGTDAPQRLTFEVRDRKDGACRFGKYIGRDRVGDDIKITRS